MTSRLGTFLLLILLAAPTRAQTNVPFGAVDRIEGVPQNNVMTISGYVFNPEGWAITRVRAFVDCAPIGNPNCVDTSTPIWFNTYRPDIQKTWAAFLVPDNNGFSIGWQGWDALAIGYHVIVVVAYDAARSHQQPGYIVPAIFYKCGDTCFQMIYPRQF